MGRRIDPDTEETTQVDLQLMNGNRVQAIVRVEDTSRIHTPWTGAKDNPNPQR